VVHSGESELSSRPINCANQIVHGI
jgi:hypothetical protein